MGPGVEEIHKLYGNTRLSGSYEGDRSFIRNRKLDNPKEVGKHLNFLPSYSLFKPARKSFRRQRVQINFLNYQVLSVDFSFYNF